MVIVVAARVVVVAVRLQLAQVCNKTFGKLVGHHWSHNAALVRKLSTSGIVRNSSSFPRYWVDETYVKVKGKWMYLYRAVDKAGASIDFYLSAHRDHLAAARFFKKALTAKHTTLPRVINVDKAASYPPAVESAKAAGYLPDETILRQVKYLNNGVEGDHMPMKRLIAPTISIFAPGPQNARTAASKTVLKP